MAVNLNRQKARNNMPENMEVGIPRRNKYNSENYDKFTLLLKKGRKEEVKKTASDKGYKSLSEYINALLDADEKNKEDNIMRRIKFELVKNEIEIGYRKKGEIVEGCTLNSDNQYPEIIKSFDNKDDAIEELKNYKSEIVEMNGNFGKYFVVTEYYVEESFYDEDGDFIEAGDVLKFSTRDTTKVLVNDVDDELEINDLEKAKYCFTDSSNSDEFNNDIMEAVDLEDLADVLNRYTDTEGNGSQFSVKEL